MKANFFAPAILLVSANLAYSADLTVERYQPDAGASHDWTGVYAGAGVSLAETEDIQKNFPIPGLGAVKVHSAGETIGYSYHVGYMHQFGDYVAGVEWEHTDLDLQYSARMLVAPNLSLGKLPLHLESTDSISARIGYAFDGAQVYGLGGMTYGKLDAGLEDWVPLLGAGIDFLVADHVIIGAQYRHNWFDKFDDEPIKGTLDNLSLRVSVKF